MPPSCGAARRSAGAILMEVSPASAGEFQEFRRVPLPGGIQPASASGPLVAAGKRAGERHHHDGADGGGGQSTDETIGFDVELFEQPATHHRADQSQ